jgi:hypothetical protein
MNTKLSRTILTLACLLSAGILAQAQAPQVIPKPTVYTTAPKMVIAKLKSGEQDVYDVRGKLTFTVVGANTDDTIAGTVTYTLPDDARQKIAAQIGKPLNAVPSTITRKDVIATFQKATAPPLIHLELSPMEVDAAGAKLRFNRVALDVNAREGNVAQYTNEEMEALFTVWAKQILNGRSRRGVIARMNRAINGEPDTQ